MGLPMRQITGANKICHRSVTTGDRIMDESIQVSHMPLLYVSYIQTASQILKYICFALKMLYINLIFIVRP